MSAAPVRAWLAVAALAASASSGCARNAFLELTIELPPDATRRYAVTQVMAGEVDFKVDWAGDSPIAPVPLDAASGQPQKLSIEGTTENEGSPIGVKVRFCIKPDCTDFKDQNAPWLGLQIERAFYIGKRTTYTWTITCVPDPAAPTACSVVTPKAVAKCEVKGCRPGTTSNSCVGDKHFCEDD